MTERAKVAFAPPPTWVTLLVLVGGLLFVGGATIGAYLHRQRMEKPVVKQSPSQPKSQATAIVTIATAHSAAPSPQVGDWRTLTLGEQCGSPCSGGVYCLDNQKRCFSGLTCVPGTGRDLLEQDFNWQLRLNAVYDNETDENGAPLDPCKTGRDYWVCIGQECLSQKEACLSEVGVARSTQTITLSGAAFRGPGVTLEVREGGRNGPLLATSLPVKDLLRGGLCNAYRVATDGTRITRVAYFLTPE